MSTLYEVYQASRPARYGKVCNCHQRPPPLLPEDPPADKGRCYSSTLVLGTCVMLVIILYLKANKAYLLAHLKNNLMSNLLITRGDTPTHWCQCKSLQSKHQTENVLGLSQERASLGIFRTIRTLLWEYLDL